MNFYTSFIIIKHIYRIQKAFEDMHCYIKNPRITDNKICTMYNSLKIESNYTKNDVII